MKQGARMARTAVFMVVAVLASKILGMLRDVLVAGAYGTSGEAVAYETASRLPLLLFDLVIGGVVTASFVPVFNELLVREGKTSAFEYANRYINLLFVLTAGLSLLGCIFSSPLVSFLAPDLAEETHALAVLLNRIMFPMMIFMALAYSLVGLLQSLGEFNLPAMISLASNGIMVLYLVFLNDRFGIVGLAVAMLYGWAVQALMQMPRAHQMGYRWRPTSLALTPHIRPLIENGGADFGQHLDAAGLQPGEYPLCLGHRRRTGHHCHRLCKSALCDHCRGFLLCGDQPALSLSFTRHCGRGRDEAGAADRPFAQAAWTDYSAHCLRGCGAG